MVMPVGELSSLEPGAAGVIGAGSAPVVLRRTLMLLIAGTLLAHVHFLRRQNVNWDEFWFLSFVHDHARGTLFTALQSFHVHLFGWLPRVGGQEIDQIIAGRSVLFLLLLGTCACVYRLARRLASVNASLFAVLCCAGYSNVLFHGTSFRTDGVGVFLLMGALVLVQVSRLRWSAVAAAALLTAVALLVTVKSVFFLPTIGVALVAAGWRSPRHLRPVLVDLLIYTTVLIGAAGALYAWHNSTVGDSAAQNPLGASLQASADKVIRRDRLFPRFSQLQDTIRGNLVQWFCLFHAAALLARKLVAREQAAQTWSAIALVFPLFSLVFYRNAFPYFYVFLMPPALVLCAVAFDRLARVPGPNRWHHAPLPLLATLAIGVAVGSYTVRYLPDTTTQQRELVAAVHTIFPTPVAYIDGHGMIGSFPRTGFFMSGWGNESYRGANRPVFGEILALRRPKFVIANAAPLSAGLALGKGALLPGDIEVLRENFVRYWGLIYVAGRRMHLSPETEAIWNVGVEGIYRLQSDKAVAIDGRTYRPGDTVFLAAGAVAITSSVAQEIVLRTNEAGIAPTQAPRNGTGSVYTGFPPSGPARHPIG
jgi:hypothetical protein